MEQNKTRAYLLYAFGEIALVMIGILLALQVNNWNEVRKQQSEQAIIIANINEEYRENLKELKISISRIDTVALSVRDLLEVIHDQPTSLSIDEFEILLQKTFVTPSWQPSSFVLEELKNSGGFSRLNFEQLESILFDWERHSAKVRGIEEGYRNYAEDYIDFLTEFGSVRNLDAISGNIPSLKKSTITRNNVNLIKNPVFENKVDNFYFLANSLVNIYKETAIKMEEIIQLTDN